MSILSLLRLMGFQADHIVVLASLFLFSEGASSISMSVYSSENHFYSARSKLLLTVSSVTTGSWLAFPSSMVGTLHQNILQNRTVVDLAIFRKGALSERRDDWQI